MLFSCILRCDAGTGPVWLELFASAVVDSYHEYHICPHTFFLGGSVALLRDSYTFV